MISNEIYRTTDFQEAIYLRKSGILFIKTEWTTPQQAVFVFKKPPDDVLVNWQTGEDGGVRVVMDAADFFRDELRRRDR
jgi:hypothetical protein